MIRKVAELPLRIPWRHTHQAQSTLLTNDPIYPAPRVRREQLAAAPSSEAKVRTARLAKRREAYHETRDPGRDSIDTSTIWPEV